MDLRALRKEYENRGLGEGDLQEDPLVILSEWVQAANENRPGPWLESNGMALATADSSGHVSVRWVLLKGITEKGIQFFTNYRSRKAKQMEENPRVAVAFHWAYLGRQIRIEGVVEKTPREVSTEYFHSRPRGSQISAAVSPQSEAVGSRAELENAKARMSEELEGQTIPCPEHWGGYLLVPDLFEFWQGRDDRLHDRFVFTKSNEGWSIERLAP